MATTKSSSARAASPKKTAKKRASISSRTKKAARKTTTRKPAARKTTARKPVPRRQPKGPSGAMLSRSTVSAKWIENAEDHEDRPGQSLATRSHDAIQKWAEERGAVPAAVTTTRQTDRPRVLRFDFPGFDSGKRLQQISWEEWFKTFDERELVFLFQEHLKSGNQSNFFRLDSPEREAA